MRIIAFLEKRDQADLIEKILKHCGLWERPPSRAPPEETEPEQGTLDLEYIPFEDIAIAQ